MEEITDKMKLFDKLSQKVSEILGGGGPKSERLQSICDMLCAMVPYYDWVGFYFVDNENPRELVLGPFVGAPTEHTRIKFGRGICGQAAEREETIIVQDVSEEENYLACSLDVRSEIVVPIFREDCIIGELDIDSHQIQPFDGYDKTFLESVAAKVAMMY